MPPNPTPTYSTGIFTGAPIVRAWSFLTVISYAVSKQKFQDWCTMDSKAIRLSFELHRYWASKWLFTSSGELVMGSLLLFYLMRKYEREFGSRKFSMLILLLNVLTMLMEMIYIQTDLYKDALYRYSGPYPTMGGLFLLFHLYAPRLYPKLFGVLGFEFSDKTFVYALFAQCIGASGLSTVAAAALGALGAQISLSVLNYLDWPDFMANVASDISEKFGETDAPLMMPLARRREQQPHPLFGNPPPNVPVARPVRVEADPAAIEQLCNMGFARSQVIDALESTNNDVQRAADRLLSQ